MSRWSAERMRIGLAPQRVDVARLGLWRGPKAARELSAACAPADGQPPWQSALDTLPALLAEFDAHRGAVAVVLSNHFVRYLALPWQAELGNAAEVQAWARLRFEHTYGAAAAEWTIRTAEGGYGRPLVACAVDTPLVDQLGQRLAALGLRLASLQPLLMAAFNDFRGQFRGRSAFAVVETDRVCLSLIDNGDWRTISSRRAGSQVAQAIEQEQATWEAQAEEETRQLDVLLVGDVSPWPTQGAPAARLLGSRETQGGRSLAMCGAL